jgi:hypothetical protein
VVKRLLAQLAIVIVVLSAGLIAEAGARAASPALNFRVFVRPRLNTDSIVWTGKQFLYVVNTANAIWAAPPAGLPRRLFARMPKLVEETRCILSSGTHGFTPGVVFCHSPDNKIYEISADGSTTRVFARLPAPYPPTADGALTFDSFGRFGYRLVAATGRSGAARPSGGTVYTVGASGDVQTIGGYDGPGGADEVAIAPAGLGSVAGDALLTVDAGPSGGKVVAIGPSGKAQTIATFAHAGPNPIVPIPTTFRTTGTPAPGLYVTDDETNIITFAPAAELAPLAGDVIVGIEATAQFWAIEAHGAELRVVRLQDNEHTGVHSLEGAIFVG